MDKQEFKDIAMTAVGKAMLEYNKAYAQREDYWKNLDGGYTPSIREERALRDCLPSLLVDCIRFALEEYDKANQH